MKKDTYSIVFYCSIPAFLAFAATVVGAAPDPKPAATEEHIEWRSTGDGANPAPRVPAPAPEPVTFLGLEVAPVDETLAAQLKLPPEHGLVVRFVAPDSPAAAAGVQKHDVLTRLDDQLLIAPRQLSALVRARKEGDGVKLTYLRAGGEARTTATLVKRVPPPAPLGDRLKWIGEGGGVHSFPAQRHIIFRADMNDAMPEADLVFRAPLPGDGTPHVMVFRPQARIVYREGGVSLAINATDKGRQLEARGADGALIYTGSIDTPEQRKALPADLQKYLEKLDALAPVPLPVPVPTPHAPPLPAPTPTHTIERSSAGPDTAVHATAGVDGGEAGMIGAAEVI